ncbi:MAG: hypothetical protein DK306_002239 [Chloroflexi bacterium]|nr:MAG: hypothetical protein DK306_002239 [Chloroflexota bacterium]
MTTQQPGQQPQSEEEGSSAVSRVFGGLGKLVKGIWTLLSVVLLSIGFVLSGGGRLLRGVAGLRFGRGKKE